MSISLQYDLDSVSENQNDMTKCSFCDENIYIKVIQYAAPILAPLTPAQALRDQLTDMTGEVYVRVKSNFCPMCGRSKK